MDGLSKVLNEGADFQLVEVVAGHAVGYVKDDVLNFVMPFGVLDKLIESGAFASPSRFRDLPTSDYREVLPLGVIQP
ncbi:MAG: hypothetical protein Q7J69_04725 [Candidatus Omnitrophota bacterium]|nr:hypothetical protein [Candidatus Omnitrophota bacterium]